MSEVTMQISIPLDKDGFLEMECDFCKNRFMLKKEVYYKKTRYRFYVDGKRRLT